MKGYEGYTEFVYTCFRFTRFGAKEESTQGLPAPVVGAMAENASLFLSYRELQNLIRQFTGEPLSQKLPLYQLTLAAAGSGAITSLVL
jgi:hypothetical protein